MLFLFVVAALLPLGVKRRRRGGNFGQWLGNSALHQYLYVPVEFRVQVRETGILPRTGRSAAFWHIVCKARSSRDKLWRKSCRERSKGRGLETGSGRDFGTNFGWWWF
jgi:hypothetical protein